MLNLTKLFISLILPFLAGGIGSYFTYPAIESWYANLDKPIFNPPNFVFGPVWTLLYLLMGVSFYFIWISKENKKRDTAIKFFVSQLFLNTLWSLVFFGLQNTILAFMNIVLLWIVVFITIKKFEVISKFAAYLLYPYILWISFAALLNLSIIILN